MNLVVAVEHRLQRTPDGAIWALQLAYTSWALYLSVFDHVRVVARVEEVSTISSNFHRADGPTVSVIALPYFVGPWRYLLHRRQVRRIAHQEVKPSDAIIVRGNPIVGNFIVSMQIQARHPYAMEMTGDLHEAFAPGAIRHPLRSLVRSWYSRELRRHCRDACATAYVSRTLQSRYPCLGHSLACSDIQLPTDAFVQEPRRCGERRSPFRLVFVGSLEQLYKAPHVLIDAIASCAKGGLDLILTILGDGRHRSELEAQASRLGIGDRVTFLGHVASKNAILEQLDQADLFVLPSFTEGMPRALIEAMARALPCIGSTAGGIPELLNKEELVAPGDSAALAAKIREMLADPERMSRASAQNLKIANDFKEEALRGKRIEFLQYVRRETELWLHKNDPGLLATAGGTA